MASGLVDPSGRFCFEGFLPRKGPSRTARLDELVDERRAVVLYEAPHRLARTVADLAASCGPDRRRGPVPGADQAARGGVAGHARRGRRHTDADAGGIEPRGEYVVVLEGAPPPAEVDDDELRAALDAALAGGATRRDAAAEVATRYGVAPNRVKRLLTG